MRKFKFLKAILMPTIIIQGGKTCYPLLGNSPASNREPKKLKSPWLLSAGMQFSCQPQASKQIHLANCLVATKM